MLRAAIIVLMSLWSPSAMACGNPLLWAMLFAQVPEAKAVHAADLAARRDNRLEARHFDARPGTNYHQWSMDWIEAAAASMAPRVTEGLTSGERLTVLLADAVVAIRFSEGKPPQVVTAEGLGALDGFDIITTVNGVHSGMKGVLPVDEMIDLGVVFLFPSVPPTSIDRLF